MTSSTESTGILAELNDLLQLDLDAVHAYRAAISHIENASDRKTLEDFLRDHERHAEDLSTLVRQRGGKPMTMPHIPTGFVKLAVQQLGRIGGDRGILRAFVSNELQVRDKYRRHADRATDPEVRELLERGAADEDRHYKWALSALERHGGDIRTGNLDRGHARTADAMEALGRRMMEKMATMRGR